MSIDMIKAGTRVRINAPGYAIDGEVGTVRFDGGGVVDLDNGKVAAVDDSEMKPLVDQSLRWCILRTSGGRTLALADSLTKAGIEAWSPRKTLKRVKAGVKPRLDGTRPLIEVDAAILPTFVFARARDLPLLVRVACANITPHPPFSIFRHGGRYPEIADASVLGLQDAEREAAAAIAAIRAAETREEAERIRRAAMKTERERIHAMRISEAERRKALRDERGDFDAGQKVQVEDVPAFTGMTGVVESSDGRSAVVVFGGMLVIAVEAWQLARA
ncbi:hypothetical protein [Sphingomonas sp. Leaf242]|uniref:hypothetical protein n=1 Tax=Sphingomonas sp. Leaf242 TaxID=1736304 RepID=UPI0007135A5E|nr:hypothetical protein [Sphingomonas sp. Leaf242]KQO13266.1 hypothetical protein ASF09_03180 [Sphingomonas sp. Leaf242]